MKRNIMIMGDSYSTFEGYLPEGYHTYYSDHRTEAPFVDEVSKTWWMQLINQFDYNLVVNDSFSGSTVCNDFRPDLSVETSFVNRMAKYVADDFFKKNHVDTFFLFGGTNDSWLNREVGDVVTSGWDETSLKCIAPAFCYILDAAKKANHAMQLVVVANTGLNSLLLDKMKQFSLHYGAVYIELSDIDKENGHPTVLGMSQIADQISKAISV